MIHLSPTILAALSVVSLHLTPAARAEAQQGDSTSIPWQMWGSVALGPSRGPDGYGRLGGNLSLWAARGSGTISVRRAGSSRVLEPGDAYDTSVLVGLHAITAPGSFAVVGVGLGMGAGSDYNGRLRDEGVIALGGQAGFDFPFVGIGLDTFAAFGRTRRYAGIGLALAVGRFH